MSDALSDLARDSRRAEEFLTYLQCLAKYLLDPNPVARVAVKTAAADVDAVHGGYWGGNTALAKKVEQVLVNLEQQVLGEWACLLNLLDRELPETAQALRLKEAPEALRDACCLEVDYGYGFVHFRGSFERDIQQILEKAGGTTYQADKFMVLIPRKILAKCPVIWLSGRNPLKTQPKKV